MAVKSDDSDGDEELDIEDIEDDIDEPTSTTSQGKHGKTNSKQMKALARQTSSMDVDEPTAEEIQDEAEDKAARPIQAMARMFLAKRHACEYGKQVFIKEYDPQRKTYAYVDTRRSPPLRQWTKPIWLGDEDLHEEKVYKSPPGYPERMQTQRQYAFVCHTAKFDDPNVPDLPSCAGVKIEHEELKERMQNPYTANFLPADTQFLWEPNKALFLKNLEALKTKCVQHVDAEAKALKYRLEKAFIETLNRLYRDENVIPTWEDASNFNSKLLDESSWRRFDKYRIAMAACRVHTQQDYDNETIRATTSIHAASSTLSMSSGGGGGGGVTSKRRTSKTGMAPLLRGNSRKVMEDEKNLFNGTSLFLLFLLSLFLVFNIFFTYQLLYMLFVEELVIYFVSSFVNLFYFIFYTFVDPLATALSMLYVCPYASWGEKHYNFIHIHFEHIYTCRTPHPY
jgi:hypothetical protein